MKKEIAIRLTSRYLIPFTYDNCKIKYDEVEQETGAWKVVEKNNREKDIYDYISDSFIKKTNVNRRIKIMRLHVYINIKILNKTLNYCIKRKRQALIFILGKCK